MESTKKAITLLLLLVIGLGCIEKDVLYNLHCAIPSTSATCDSGADNHNGIHHHSHVTDCVALKGSERVAEIIEGQLVVDFPSVATVPSNVATSDTWQPPKFNPQTNRLV